MGHVYSDWGAPVLTTSANLPAAASASPYRLYMLTDFKNSLWYSDGSNWYPLNGQSVIAKECGSLSIPLGTLSLNGSNQVFVLPAGDIRIPPALLSIGRTSIRIDAHFVHHGTAGTVQGRAGCHTAPTLVAQTIQGATLTAVEGSNAWIRGDLYIASATKAFSHTFVVPNSPSGSAGAITENSVNPAIDLYVVFGVLAATGGTAPDTLDLIEYEVAIRGCP